MMEMIRCFYEKEYVGDGDLQPTVDLFKDKKIWAAGEKYRNVVKIGLAYYKKNVQIRK